MSIETWKRIGRDAGARRARRRLAALLHTGPERCWRRRVGVLEVAGVARDIYSA